MAHPEKPRESAPATTASEWGRSALSPEEGHFLSGPQKRGSELARLARITAGFIRGFRALQVGLQKIPVVRMPVTNDPSNSESRLMNA